MARNTCCLRHWWLGQHYDSLLPFDYVFLKLLLQDTSAFLTLQLFLSLIPRHVPWLQGSRPYSTKPHQPTYHPFLGTPPSRPTCLSHPDQSNQLRYILTLDYPLSLSLSLSLPLSLSLSLFLHSFIIRVAYPFFFLFV